MELTQPQIAEAMGVSQRTIRNWEKQGFPSVGTGPSRSYDLADCIRWRVEEERRRTRDEVDERPTDEDWKAARARKEAALATKHEMEVRERAGELVEVEAVQKMFAAKMSRVRELLLAWPGRVGAEIAGEVDAKPREVSAALEVHVRKLLERAVDV